MTTDPTAETGPPPVDPAVIESMFVAAIPYCATLGLKFIGFRKHLVTLALPYREDFIGDPEFGTLHGGAITGLIDSVAGMAVFARIRKLLPIATLDLRIDYLKPAKAGLTVHATGECYKVTRSIAFVRATAYHPETPDDLVAACACTFMIGSSDQIPLPKGHPAAP